jgi:hypothetical protein
MLKGIRDFGPHWNAGIMERWDIDKSHELNIPLLHP